MKKLIIRFFILMMIIGDNPRGARRVFAARAPIVDLFDSFFAFSDEPVIRVKSKDELNFLLSEDGFFAKKQPKSRSEILLNLKQYDYSGFAGFSRIVKQKLHLN